MEENTWANPQANEPTRTNLSLQASRLEEGWYEKMNGAKKNGAKRRRKKTAQKKRRSEGERKERKKVETDARRMVLYGINCAVVHTARH